MTSKTVTSRQWSPMRVNGETFNRLILTEQQLFGSDHAKALGHKLLEGVTDDEILRIALGTASIEGDTVDGLTYEENE